LVEKRKETKKVLSDFLHFKMSLADTVTRPLVRIADVDTAVNQAVTDVTAECAKFISYHDLSIKVELKQIPDTSDLQLSIVRTSNKDKSTRLNTGIFIVVDIDDALVLRQQNAPHSNLDAVLRNFILDGQTLPVAMLPEVEEDVDTSKWIKPAVSANSWSGFGVNQKEEDTSSAEGSTSAPPEDYYTKLNVFSHQLEVYTALKSAFKVSCSKTEYKDVPCVWYLETGEKDYAKKDFTEKVKKNKNLVYCFLYSIIQDSRETGAKLSIVSSSSGGNLTTDKIDQPALYFEIAFQINFKGESPASLDLYSVRAMNDKKYNIEEWAKPLNSAMGWNTS
jgi:hypothetical protein